MLRSAFFLATAPVRRYIRRLSCLKSNAKFCLSFSGNEQRSQDLPSHEIVYNHKLLMKKFAKIATCMQVDDKLIVRVFDPPAIGDFGVDMSKLEFYKIANPDARKAATSETNYPCNSWMRAIFPFSKAKEIRQNMTAFGYSKIRYGRLLEIMDFMGAAICYDHCKADSNTDWNNITIVTASVDNIEFYPTKISIEQDLIVEAYLTFTGTSSMEVRIDTFNSDKELFCTAYFLMVARNNKTQKAYKVLSLASDFEVDKPKTDLRWELGKIRNQRRKSKNSRSVYKQPPNSEESAELHHFLMNTDEELEGKFKSMIDLSSTRVEKSILKFEQDRNIHGKIFGGLLMRESLEIALVCAYRQGNGSFPHIYHIDDVRFILPVDIGI